MRKMSEREKLLRSQARHFGQRARWNMENSIAYGREAIEWRTFGANTRNVDAIETANGLATSRQAISDQLLEDAVTNARRAYRLAADSVNG